MNDRPSGPERAEHEEMARLLPPRPNGTCPRAVISTTRTP